MFLDYTQDNHIEKKSNKAISLCLYKTERFNHEKHIIPLQNFLNNNNCKEYDILIFHDGNIEIPVGENVRTFLVNSKQTGFHKHIWRYLGCRELYESLWFRGADTTEIPLREKKLETLTTFLNCNLLIFPSISSTGHICTGRFFCNKNGKEKLNTYITNNDIKNTNWHCDEEFLTDWVVSDNSLKLCVALDKSLLNLEKINNWINDRLKFGNHTIIIKDRDDTPLLKL